MPTCECGCGEVLTGKAKRWKNDDHKNEFNTRVRRAASEMVRMQRNLPLDGKRVAATLAEAVSEAVAIPCTVVPCAGNDAGSSWKKIVFDAISEHPGSSRSEISAFTGLKLSSVCGRVNELLLDRPPSIRVSGMKLDQATQRKVEILEVARVVV